jgi:hypothetical protein
LLLVIPKAHLTLRASKEVAFSYDHFRHVKTATVYNVYYKRITANFQLGFLPAIAVWPHAQQISIQIRFQPPQRRLSTMGVEPLTLAALRWPLR